jgi:hypothetical protein
MLTAKILGVNAGIFILPAIPPCHNLQVRSSNSRDFTHLSEYLLTVYPVFQYQEYL